MFRVFLLLALFSFQVFSQTVCPNATTAYKIFVIDGVPNGALVNCTYAFNISAGNCTINTAQTPLAIANYVCFGEKSQTCSNINLYSVTGIVSRNCSGNYVTETFTIPSVTPTQEFAINTTYINAKAAIG